MPTPGRHWLGLLAGREFRGLGLRQLCAHRRDDSMNACQTCGLRASYFDPWQAEETWYCGKCAPQPIKDYHQLRDAVRLAASQIEHLLKRGPDHETKVVLLAADARLQRALYLTTWRAS